MNRRIRLWLLMAMVLLAFSGAVSVTQAAEAEEMDAAEEKVPDLTAKKLTGWQVQGDYRFYYTSTGSMVTGWKKIDEKIYFFRKKADGDAPKGSMATGFCKIKGKIFYFSPQGVLETSGGWKTIEGKNYYLTSGGNVGTLGALYVGLKVIDGDRFYFQEDGSAAIGWVTIKKKTYFFSTATKLGIRGRALTGWKKIGKYSYYFDSQGVMQKNKWIDKTYYVNDKGRMLVSSVTPDGYLVDSNGERGKLAHGWIRSGTKVYYYVSGKKTVGWKKIGGKKYYFNKNGVRQDGWITVAGSKYYLKDCVMQTGWQTIDGKMYYFKSGGKMAANVVIDDIVIGEDGVAQATAPVENASVLIIAGHGQGDVGAIGYYAKNTYYEYQLTREFASLIGSKLAASGSGVNVTMYDQNYDCYQVIAKRKAGPDPDFEKYDYVLEVHFNATVSASKDPNGDGVCKGAGMYVNSAKKDTTLDRKIIASIASKTGFAIWGRGTGIFTSSGLLNARTCQELGVSYGLLETAFIDDKDDITFYKKNKDAMAQAVANAVASHFSS